LYGAKLLENIVQAVARIVLTDAELFLASKGYEAALSVHDELLFLVPDNQAEKFSTVLERVLTLPIPWMPHLPLEAEVAYGDTYYECK
jgi:DNA polymerase